MTYTRITRRHFLKTGCVTAAAAGLAVCSISVAAPTLDPSPMDLPSFTYGDKTMKDRILVAYASALGSTVDVAAEISRTLAARGFSVDVRPINENLQVDGYQAVLVGSAVQYGNWLPEAVDFVRTNQQALNRIPVALFCVHIRNLGNDEASRKNRLAYLDAVRPLLQPLDEGYFAGRFDRRGAALLLPGWLARFIPPMDFRNWEKISAWADSLHPLLH